MQAGEEKADAEVGEQDRHKAQDRQPGDAAALPALDQSRAWSRAA